MSLVMAIESMENHLNLDLEMISISDLSYLFTKNLQVIIRSKIATLIILFVCFVALRPKSTAMVIAGRSVHLTTLFPGQA